MLVNYILRLDFFAIILRLDSYTYFIVIRSLVPVRARGFWFWRALREISCQIVPHRCHRLRSLQSHRPLSFNAHAKVRFHRLKQMKYMEHVVSGLHRLVCIRMIEILNPPLQGTRKISTSLLFCGYAQLHT